MTLLVEQLDETTATTPRGRRARFALRHATSDGALVGGIVDADEYGLRQLPELSGWAIDIGAHIGTVAVSLAIDNPELRILAVEALPENVEILRRNIDANGLADRVLLVQAAAGSEAEHATGATVGIAYGWSAAPNQPDGYMADNRFIGGMVGPNDTSAIAQCPVISLGALLEEHAIADVALLKIDCEGCEWFVLSSPAIARIQLILGEMHVGRHGGATELRAMLEPTLDVEMDDTLVVAHFTAVRR